MDIKFSTILDLKVNKKNVEMIENEVEKINDGMLGISFADHANGYAVLHKEIVGSSLYFDIWSSTCNGITSNIEVTLKFVLDYTMDNKRKKENIENIKNILIYINSLSGKNETNDLSAYIRPFLYKLIEKYSTHIEKCLITHEFVGVNQNEIKEFLKHIIKIEESSRYLIYEE
ncbi:hypothetical protein KGF43_15675 [Clostridioides sp. ZZV14-6044]|uniref:hypothetical protein n=1 Tax=Clostridioides sp. ZZV14-6044 TaxID=2811488 RepID=UPI001C17FBC7|nr:hypothetical protein [Clostridioides sp. ZZV14-6044]HBF5866218.1 hypothetical protein [Clostridioides difficile]